MAKQTRRRRNSQSKQEDSSSRQSQQQRQPQRERTVAILPDAIVRANPFEPMERLMQAFMPFGWMNPWVSAAAPAPKLDVIDRDSTVVVRAEVPGVRKNDLAVEASDMSVTIKGQVQQEDTREDEHYRISETSHGTFERTVQLPSDVDSTRAKATFKDGVVEVILPKVDRSRPHHVKL
jgi:HSP20 family protein